MHLAGFEQQCQGSLPAPTVGVRHFDEAHDDRRLILRCGAAFVKGGLATSFGLSRR
jgi:hypothetical protein